MALGGFTVPGQSDPTAITLLRQELRALSLHGCDVKGTLLILS